MRISRHTLRSSLLPLLLLAMPAASVAQLDPNSIQTLPVGHIGNADDPVALFQTGGGRVDVPFRIAAHEVTNGQYAAFLNSVAQAGDPFGLYHPSMQTSPVGGIVRSGVARAFSYAPKAGMEDHPVVFVSWLDAARFVNWLENQEIPWCEEGRAEIEESLGLAPDSLSETLCRTETGTYDLIGLRDPGSQAVRVGHREFAGGVFATGDFAEPGAPTWFLPDSDEWHKAAYHDPLDPGADADTHGRQLMASPDYWHFPTRSDQAPAAELPPGGANSANYLRAAGGLTAVGAYAGTTSFYGAFDMAGNVMEWTESLDPFGTGERVILGGSYRPDQNASLPEADSRISNFADVETDFIGFRVAKAELLPIPFTAQEIEFSALGERFVATFDAHDLPERPAMTAAVELDAANPDLQVEIEIFDCTTISGGGICPPFGISNPASSPTQAVASFVPCEPRGADPGDVCAVSVRPLDFGGSGAPARLSLDVFGTTVLPTGTTSVSVDPTEPPVMDFVTFGATGLQSFIESAENFRWNYDGRLGSPVDGVLETEQQGLCITEPVPNAGFADYSYDFLGPPDTAVVDCCVWLVDGRVGDQSVTGVGQFLWPVNLPEGPQPDMDGDGIVDLCDNCPGTPNGPLAGTCVGGPDDGQPCPGVDDCAGPGFCSRIQEDPDLDGQGIACPEPGMLALLAPGILALLRLKRRRQRTPRTSSGAAARRAGGVQGPSSHACF